jgi:ketosteroid isomerase-like protein
MSDLAFVDRFLESWNAHAVEDAMAFMTEDCVWEVPRGSEPWGTRYRGAAAMRLAIAAAFRTMPDIHYEVVRASFGVDLVILELLVTGTQADGTRARFHACDVMTLRGGKVSAKRSYRKVAE